MNKMEHTMIEKIIKYMESYEMIRSGDGVILGVSGGADSVCLFHVMLKLRKRYHLKLYVVHVNHGIRLEDGLADQKYVEHLCEQHEIPCKVYSFDVKKYAKQNGLSEEEAGRKLRYQSFYQELKKWEADKIAVAHNMDDQAETVLFHMFRGSGMKGLAGIMPMRDQIIRPLLRISRQEIENYLNERQIPFQTDVTNMTDAYARNKIRLRIMPYVKEQINAQAISNIVRTSTMVSEVEGYLERVTQEAFDRIVVVEKGQYSFDVEAITKEDIVVQKRVIRQIIGLVAGKLKDIEEKHVLDVLSLLAKSVGKQIDLPYGICARRKYKQIIIEKRKEKEEKQPICMSIDKMGEYSISEKEEFIRFELKEYKKNMLIPKNRYTKWFDYDKIKNTISVRTRMQGDFIQIDQRGSKKKLKSFFVDNKIPQEIRDQIPLVCDDHHIMWVVGERISEAYKVTEQTKKILVVEVYGGKHVR
ncbi:tRNA(Ile)-lysidine synthetase [Lachnospiraceae bacterium KM106-2]|nr:tRNA(Ile)-lysidine synthetase [Lachnospiraceae bacterium KM106-2]